MLRVANKYWFQYIKIDDFTIYFATPKKIPEIVQHFATVYEDTPIGISLQKIVTNKPEEFPLELFGTLTHLTSFDSFPLSFDPDGTALRALTNLQRFIPMESCSALTNLTSLLTSQPYAYLSMYTNLRDLYLTFPRLEMNPFTVVTNPSRLTVLRFLVKQMEWSEDGPNLMTQFKNLKHLIAEQLTDNVMPRFAHYLTSLERLNLLFRAELHEDDICSLTQLTHLWVDKYHNISTLKNLKYLHMTFEDKYEKDYSFLSVLTNLETLHANLPTDECLHYLNSQKLTAIQFSGTNPVLNADGIFKLSSLLELRAHEMLVRSISENYKASLGLANLTKLDIEVQNPTSVQYTVLNNLTNLKRLHLNDTTGELTGQMDSNVTLGNLPNLEELILKCVPSQTMYDDFSRLTRLTSLTITLPHKVMNNNPTALHKLPLRELVFNKQIISPHVWDLLSRLTDLEALDVWRIPSESAVESFSVLTNLTRLHALRTRVIGIHLTKLTSLQNLFFISKPARKFYEKKLDYLLAKLTRLQEKRFRT
jgi:hypothetical protein